MRISWIFVFIFIAVHESSGNCNDFDRLCYCDKKCLDYGDCCPEYKDVEQVSWRLRNISSCKFFNMHSKSMQWVIDKCRSRNHFLSNLCSRKVIHPQIPLKSYIPVIDINHEIYGNVFCAQCNGINQYEYLNVSVRCKNKEIMNIESLNKILKKDETYCKIKPHFDQTKQRNCSLELIEICPEMLYEDHEDIAEKCQYGINDTVTDGIKVYRNMDCCKCWNSTCFYIEKSLSGSDRFSYFLNFHEWNDFNFEEITAKTNGTRFEKGNQIKKEITFYFSFIFTCLSMISLFILILLYFTQKMFHNFAGYLTLCLCSCLWLLNCGTLLVTNPNIVQSVFCKYLAILQHFIALSSFLWMAVYSFELLQTFGLSYTNFAKKKTLKSFFIYCVNGFLFIFIFVGSSSIVEFTTNANSTIRPGYGGSHCWFTNQLGGIIWYFIPVCLLLLWNCGICIIVFYRLMRTTKECHLGGNVKRKSTLWLCIRLTSIFGIGYFCQVVAVLIHVEDLILLGTIINSLQGFLLALCFGCTGRIFP